MQSRRNTSDDPERQGSDSRGVRDYEAFDRVFDVIGEVFRSLHEDVASEERWRWDIPVVTFSWMNRADANCNLNGLVLGEISPQAVEIESNAWIDQYEDGALVRHWKHFPVGRFQPQRNSFPTGPTLSEHLLRFVSDAYQSASTWSKEGPYTITDISPDHSQRKKERQKE